jgi:hypothetical protein
MNMLKRARQQAGCDQEELWFYEKDRELIEKMKAGRPRLRLIEGGRNAPAQPEESEASHLSDEEKDAA